MSKILKIIGKSYTFDDLLIVPGYSKVPPHLTDLRTHLTKNIVMNVPMLTAAMDTVTESAMAIAIARQGGIGIIHKNMQNIDEQVHEVREVKRSESFIIPNPITLLDTALVAEAKKIMKEYKIGGIPIVNEKKQLIGIVTNRDLRFEKNTQMAVSEIMTKENLITARETTTFEQADSILEEFKIEKLPIVDGDNVLRGLITFRDIEKTKLFPNACKDEQGRLRVGAAVGVTEDVLDRVAKLMEVEVDVVIVDTAHGHSEGVLETVRKLKKAFPQLQLIAGNVATAEGALDLVAAGADAVKVGIGPGSICTTRIVSGCGMPQLTAIMNCAEALQGSGIPIIADGGIRYSGDIVKAIAAGASSIMAGGLFAGTDEAPGDTVTVEGRKFKLYRGMGSIQAMKDGSGDRYRQNPKAGNRLIAEGVEGRVPHKGPLSEVLSDFVGGLRIGMGYAGAANIEELQTKARFTIVTSNGVIEGKPHDVTVTGSSSQKN